jgi:xanthine dehydrogenase YagS FAD-binding subunit
VKPFSYLRAESVGGAVLALAEHPHAKPLGGGTNLVDLMRLGVERPASLVDVSHLDLGGVNVTADGGIRIGAGMRNGELAADPIVRERYPVLSRALLAGASGQLRNMATVGGNLLQRTRCVYFMDSSKPCNKREPGSGCPAIEGISRDLAILGTSPHCIANYPGDMAVALSALDAVVHFETLDGSGSLPIGEFYRLPGEHPEIDTRLPVGALITAVELPGIPFGAVSTYRKARDRRSFAFALVSVAAAIDVQDGIVRDIRLALGGVAHKPWRATTAENALRGGPATRDAFAAAAAAELAAATPTEQNAFKVPMATRMITGVLAQLAGVAE